MLLILAATLAAAPPPSPQDAPGAAQDSGIVVTGEIDKKNKRVCKRTVTTGSLMQKVTCRTVSEWEAEDIRNQTAMERLRGDQRWSEAARSEKAAAGN